MQSNQTPTSLGAKLRDLRMQLGISIRAFAAQVDFSPSFISQLEADGVSPSIASLEKIGRALGVTLGQLFSSIEQTKAARLIVRNDARASYTSTWSDSTVAVLADPAYERTLSALELKISPGGMSSRRPEARPDDTVALVVQGSIVLVLDDAEELLSAGDTAYLPAGMGFAWQNRGDAEVTLLLVSTDNRANLTRDLVKGEDAPPVAE